MTSKRIAPYVHTHESHNSLAYDFLVALVPIIIWSVFMFGGRVISLMLIGVLSAFALDYPIQRFVFKRSKEVQIDIDTAVYAILAVFMLPVSVPLWFPTLSSILVVIAKNLRVFRAKRLFNPYVFSAALLNLCFPKIMTAFTKPFAYFSAFDITIDPILLDNYRVISPLQYMADGSVYEDGVLAQLYGYASGNIGEIAIFAMIFSVIWLLFRKKYDLLASSTMLAAVLLLALMFPSSDAESNYYAFSVLFSGGLIFLAVFALNENCTLPQTKLGRFILALVAGVAIFLLRKFAGGYEWGYLVILALNAVSPFIEIITRPRVLTDFFSKAFGKK